MRPEPLPEFPEEKLIQGALLVAVHAQVFAARMLRLPAPPRAPKDCATGAMTYWHWAELAAAVPSLCQLPDVTARSSADKLTVIIRRSIRLTSSKRSSATCRGYAVPGKGE